MIKTKKIAEYANHRNAWKGYIGTLLTGVAAYFSVPVIQDKSDSIAIMADGIEVRQDKYIKQNERIILNQEIDMALRFPPELLDSVRKAILFDKFWHDNN